VTYVVSALLAQPGNFAMPPRLAGWLCVLCRVRSYRSRWSAKRLLTQEMHRHADLRKFQNGGLKDLTILGRFWRSQLRRDGDTTRNFDLQVTSMRPDHVCLGELNSGSEISKAG